MFRRPYASCCAHCYGAPELCPEPYQPMALIKHHYSPLPCEALDMPCSDNGALHTI